MQRKLSEIENKKKVGELVSLCHYRIIIDLKFGKYFFLLYTRTEHAEQTQTVVYFLSIYHTSWWIC